MDTIRAAALAIFALCAVPQAFAIAPNTVISNTAYVSYNVPATGQVFANQPSNTVFAVVQQVGAFTLTSSQSRLAAPNGVVVFAHTLTNTGNGSDTFDLSVVNPAAACGTCSFTLQNVQLFADANGDGVPDNATPITGTSQLAPGAIFTFVAIATVPATAIPAIPPATPTQSSFDINAQGNAAAAALGGYAAAAQQTNTDNVTVSSGGVINSLRKSLSTSIGPSPAGPVTVTLTYSNSGVQPANNVRIEDWIGLANANPALDTTGFTYVLGSARWSGCAAPLTDAAEASGVYECGPSAAEQIRFQFVPAPLAGQPNVIAEISSVSKNVSGTLTFQIQVNSGLASGKSKTNNAARVQYCDSSPSAAVCAAGATNQSSNSNLAPYEVVANSGVDLTIAKTVTRPSSAGMTINNPGEFTLQVSNIGTQATAGPISVSDTLPGGLDVTGVTGIGWSCTQSGVFTTGTLTGGGVTVTCTTSTSIVAKSGATAGLAQPIRISVTPRVVAGVLVLPAAPGASLAISNTATVSGGGENPANLGNNSATVNTSVGPSATVRGRVWQDVNHNRRWDGPAIDRALNNWTIEVIDLTTLQVVPNGSGITTAGGDYVVSNLIPGQYGIRFRDPESNIVNGRPVCGDSAAAASDSYAQGNCGAADLSGNRSQLDPTGTFLKVTLVPGDTILEQNLPLDPSGIVYDSVTGVAVAGAVVSMSVRDVNNTPVAGFNAAIHLVGGAGSLVQTVGSTGFYQYILTGAGVTLCAAQAGGGCILELSVTPPAGYRPFAQSLALFPPQPSTTCLLPNCFDSFAQPLPILVSPINTSPILPTPQPYYLRMFLSPGDADVVNNHFPLIPNNFALGANLLVTKTAGKATAEVGDFVDYTVRVFNGSALAANTASIVDTLPAGFKYVAGTSRFTVPPATVAIVLADPAGGAGPRLTWPAGTIAAGATVTLTYRAQLSINSVDGDGINRALATAFGFGSNTATAKVRVLGGVFSDRGFITGTIFADCNRDRVQGPREPGIPGVRLYMEDGTNVVTDSEGKYSLYGVSPRTHVMKIDDTTLPLGSELIALSNRNAGDPSSRFVDVKKGELTRADFAEGSCSPDVMRQIKARREKGETAQAELNRAFAGALAQIPVTGAVSGVGAPAQGNVGASGAKPLIGAEATAGGAAPAVVPVFQPVQAQGPAGSLNSSNSNLPPKQGDATSAQLPDVAQPALSTLPLEELIVNMDNSFAILNLKDGDTLPSAQVNIQLKGTLGANFIVRVNGGPEVPASRIGKRSTLESRQIQAWEFIGIGLNPGVNEIAAYQTDSFGNTRGEIKLKVTAPGSLGKIVIDTVDSASADGATPIMVRVRLTDDKGTLVTSRTSITLQSSLGRWLVQDLNPLEPGTQVFVTGGQAEYQLAAPADPGETTIEVSGGVLKSTKKVSFLPHLRPLIGAGIIEGAINFNSLSLKNLISAQSRDNFEQEIRRFHYESGDGKRSTEARTSMFLKGKVKGEYLLTLAYDSDKDLRERVFRDISPDEFYPIYGDSSARSFDAQTSGRFFVRVDKAKSYVLYGDYATAAPAGARALSQFSRTLTGAKWHVEGAPYSINTFASRDTFRQRVQEFNANGTSGPFLLSLPSGSVINSEKVEIITRDRNQPGLILLAEIKGRFADYEIDNYSGRLLFRAPVSSLDANFNPLSIRITYEIDQGGTPFWIGGVDAQYKLTDSIEVGGMMVKDQNPGQEFSMGGLNATWKIFEKTVLVTEVARTNRNAPAVTAGTATGATVGAGNASRIELRHADGNLDARLFAGRSDVTFDNPSSTLNRGRAESGARATYKLTPSTNLSTEFLRTGDVSTGATREALSLRADHSFSNGVRVEAGLRHTSELSPASVNGLSVGTTPNEFTSVLVKATAPVPGLPQASVNASYEQSIKGDERKAIGLGAEYKLSPSARLYGRYESINSLTGSYGLTPAQKNNTAVFGIDTKVTESTQVFTEYRGRSSLDGATSEASMGVRNTWAVAEGLRVTGSLERLQPIQRLATGATVVNESTAVTGGVEYTANPLWKGSARLELRNSTTTDSVLSTASLAYKLTRDWAMLARNVYSHTTQKGATPGDQDRWRFQLGAAYRDTDTNKLSALARYEHRDERNTVAAPSLRSAAEIVSMHFNYQANRSSVFSGRYAAKYVTEDALGILSKSSGQLISGRVTHDISSKWDVGIVSSLHTDGGLGNRKAGLGLEVGYLLHENLWLSGGYNLFGFKDKDLAGADYTDKGFYVRLRYKFDETLFDWNKDTALRNGAAAVKP